VFPTIGADFVVILIVSQVVPVRHALRVLLEREGHKVLVADTVASAAEVISKNSRLDVVICERKLDDGTAMTLQRRSQEIDRVADHGAARCAPQFLVLATPQASSRIEEGRTICDEIRSFGFQDVFEKPVNRHELLQRLRVIAIQRACQSNFVAAESPPCAAENRAVDVPAISPCPTRASAAIRCLARLEEQVSGLRTRLDAECKALFELAQSLRQVAVDLGAAPPETGVIAVANRGDQELAPLAVICTEPLCALQGEEPCSA
jgi:CheY-like chemotaxis protein